MKSSVKAVLFSAVFALGFTAFGSNASACSVDGKEGFLPKNDLYIPVRKLVRDRDGNPVGGGITEKEFNGVIDAVEKIYAPVVKELGGELQIERNWTDGTVNAYASRQGKTWTVAMFGGLARHKETTIDGFMLVVCHELGHHIGGAPKYKRGRQDEWASNEGESDYFATLKCARRVLYNAENVEELGFLEVPAPVKENCDAQFPKDPEDAAICVRSALGGKALARLLGSLGGSRMPEFDTPDPSKVSETKDAHPAAQCRLDTYYSGGLCDKDLREEVSQVDPIPGTCTQEKGFKMGYRPRCWYAPGKENVTYEIRKGAKPADEGVKYW